MIELKLISEFPQEMIALDEVGRSPLSGPVVIGGVRISIPHKKALESLLRSLRCRKIKDSKMLTHEKRQAILNNLKIADLPFRTPGSFLLKEVDINYVTWEMHHDVIDVENIFQASMRGMKEAAIALSLSDDKSHTTVLIDGQVKLRWAEEALNWKEIAIIRGDEKSPLIGLASIIAKEKRDNWMREAHVLYPHYGFETNFGYPTKEHRQAIEVHGPCAIHRRSFGKVKEFVIPTIKVG